MLKAADYIDLRTVPQQTKSTNTIPYITTNGIVSFYVVGSGIALPKDFQDWYKPQKYFG